MGGGENSNYPGVGGGGGGGGGGDGAVINVRCSNGAKFAVRSSLVSTVGAFKEVVAQNCDVPADQQRLIYKGRILKDDQTLESYGLQAEHTVHMVRGSSPANTAPPPTTATVANNNPTPAVSRGVGSNDGGVSGLGASLFPGLGANASGGGAVPGLFGAGLPEFEQVHQQLTQNPNMMREIMNMPAVQNLMNNPELMRGLIMNNPQMREIMDRNPELAHVLNDPGILRQTLEVARNPELMREMMRNTDRAMSNIEATPEGFNMLRRMYENVQEPFLNATTMGGNNRSDLSSNPFAALLGTQGGAQVRDSSNNSSTGSTETTTGAVPNTNPLPNPWSNLGGAPTGTGLDLLMNMFGGLGAGAFNAPNTPDVPPEELYVTQLSQLQEMGFFDTQENIRALRATAGNVHAAVERLLGNPGQ
ncbi:hypothetical protein CRG98_003809 [Punica granatum]|uniref:Ubiquitin domain-containing protein DSK2a-like n=1 Tax=Punica granatum TaxID=22663 RepID=A0A2I0L6N8_PUNGR|nr:hypothetical protein CRG98_003809 [Punica granatum]